MLEQLYSTEHVAEIMGISTRSVERWRREGKLRPVKAGRLIRYPEAQLNRFLGIDSNGVFTPNEHVDENGDAIGELAEALKMAA
jgi:excisionase family DNA binding protein